jgi:hypothetical protein
VGSDPRFGVPWIDIKESNVIVVIGDAAGDRVLGVIDKGNLVFRTCQCVQNDY